MLTATIGEHFVRQIEVEIDRILYGHLQDANAEAAIAKLQTLAGKAALFGETEYGPLLREKISAAIRQLGIFVKQKNPQQMTNLILKWVKQFDHVGSTYSLDSITTEAVVSVRPTQPTIPIRQGPVFGSMLPLVVLLAILLDLLHAKYRSD